MVSSQNFVTHKSASGVVPASLPALSAKDDNSYNICGTAQLHRNSFLVPILLLTSCHLEKFYKMHSESVLLTTINATVNNSVDWEKL